MADKYYVGDIGTEIRLLVVDEESGIDDISDATVHKLLVRKPDGSEVEWEADIEGTQYLTYTVQDGDLDQPGTYRVQAYLELPSGWSGKGTTFTFEVHDEFE